MSIRELEQGQRSLQMSGSLPIPASPHASSHYLVLDVAKLNPLTFKFPDCTTNQVTIWGMIMFIAQHWNRVSGYAHPTATEIETALGISDKTRKKILGLVRDQGWFGVIEGKAPRKGEKTGTANRYYPLWNLHSKRQFTTALTELDIQTKAQALAPVMEEVPEIDNSIIPPF